MNFVLDTNVFISGLFWKGPSYKLLNLWKNKRFQLVTSMEILEEINKVLNDFKIRLPSEIVVELINLIIKNSIIVQPNQKFNVSIDPKDNIFLEAAKEGDVDYIISHDKHLLRLMEFQGIKIIKPEEALKLF